MARGIQKWTPEVIARLKLDGRGIGEGSNYKPWIDVVNVSSLGRSRRVFSPITGRQHELLSDVEWNLFLMLEWAEDVIDIREQFPLDCDLTQEIASALQIHHPFYPRTKVPTVMTADFLVTRRKNGKSFLEAFNAKCTEEAEDVRSLEKLEIQRAYFDGMGVRHHVVYSSEIPMEKVRTIEWIRSGYLKEGETEPYLGFFKEHVDRIATELGRVRSNQTLNEYCEEYTHRFAIPTGTALRCSKMLMHSRTLIADLQNVDLASAPLSSFHINQPRKQMSLTKE
ncbi:TnsA endonuclease N-terminal domain-containing protein [Undibacterium sp.]|uniref:TnsA endonuclease N-terminal domain-containing protein n=1 Tax=Undibacterium sp. TaxID=1914977 RepID=UPI0025EC3761|nr:TnsA endonuclease N-terminal domain-containing protein [Undibacterium sp.]